MECERRYPIPGSAAQSLLSPRASGSPCNQIAGVAAIYHLRGVGKQESGNRTDTCRTIDRLGCTPIRFSRKNADPHSTSLSHALGMTKGGQVLPGEPDD